MWAGWGIIILVEHTIGFCSSISATPNIVAAFPAGDPGVLRFLTWCCCGCCVGSCWEEASPLGNIFLRPKLMLYVGLRRFLSNNRITPYSIRAPKTWKIDIEKLLLFQKFWEHSHMTSQKFASKSIPLSRNNGCFTYNLSLMSHNWVPPHIGCPPPHPTQQWSVWFKIAQNHFCYPKFVSCSFDYKLSRGEICVANSIPSANGACLSSYFFLLEFVSELVTVSEATPQEFVSEFVTVSEATPPLSRSNHREKSGRKAEKKSQLLFKKDSILILVPNKSSLKVQLLHYELYYPNNWELK